MNAPKLIIIDRDGVIVEEGLDYLLDSKNIVIKPNVINAFEILKTKKIPVVMATKQRCISKGLISLYDVEKINKDIESMIGFKFSKIFIERKNSTKLNLFGAILNSYKLNPSDILLIDNNIDEIMAAKTLGFNTIHSDDLFSSIKLCPF